MVPTSAVLPSTGPREGPTVRVDLHCHTHHSPDSRTGFDALAGACLKAGIGVLAVTDHDTVEGGLAFRDHCRERGLPLQVIPGEEVWTPEGEVIGLYLDATIPRLTPLDEAVSAIRDQGGLVLVEHPFDTWRHGLGERARTVDADIVETFNARTVRDGANAKARRLAAERGLPACACSDAHTPDEVGVAYTEVPPFDAGDPDALLSALAEGRTVEGRSSPWARVRSSWAKVLDRVGR